DLHSGADVRPPRATRPLPRGPRAAAHAGKIGDRRRQRRKQTGRRPRRARDPRRRHGPGGRAQPRRARRARRRHLLHRRR
ncbi:MAG: hypothetical protein AVDCRST_MAG67-2220, partial [uncultured Solirubrobacteraceae bacterium]